MKFSARPAITKKAPVAWYLYGVNINYSFSSLERISVEMGATIDNGDIIIVDNKNKDKRKAYKKTPNGHVILYVQLLNGNEFTTYENGRLDDRANAPLLNFFNV